MNDDLEINVSPTPCAGCPMQQVPEDLIQKLARDAGETDVSMSVVTKKALDAQNQEVTLAVDLLLHKLPRGEVVKTFNRRGIVLLSDVAYRRALKTEQTKSFAAGRKSVLIDKVKRYLLRAKLWLGELEEMVADGDYFEGVPTADVDKVATKTRTFLDKALAIIPGDGDCDTGDCDGDCSSCGSALREGGCGADNDD